MCILYISELVGILKIRQKGNVGEFQLQNLGVEVEETQEKSDFNMRVHRGERVATVYPFLGERAKAK